MLTFFNGSCNCFCAFQYICNGIIIHCKVNLNRKEKKIKENTEKIKKSKSFVPNKKIKKSKKSNLYKISNKSKKFILFLGFI